MWQSVALAGVLVFVTSRILHFLWNLKSVAYLPGFRCAFAPLSLTGAILPTSYLNPGLDWQWMWRASVYQYYGSRTISSVPFLSGPPYICTASLDLSKQVLSGAPGVFKSPQSMAALMLWGDNVISANYDAYRRHRRIVGPAFSGSTYVEVARETSRLYHEMMDGEQWSERNTFSVTSINKYISKFALGIITRCGFGLPFPWVNAADDGTMSFDTALTIVSEGIITRLATPRWAYKLPIKKLRDLDEAYRTLSMFMHSMIATKNEELAAAASDQELSATDLFTRLIHASGAEGKNGLNDEELIGNMFAFLFAGHETTAHTISAALALLAFHEDDQDRLVTHIREVVPDGRDPTLDDISRLDKVTACFWEAARMFPAGSIVTRDTTETTTFTFPPEERRDPLVVPPGIRIFIDMIGLNYNPEAFAEPERFNPSRWYGARESDVVAFGLGPRACLGRRFAVTEAVCFLTVFVRDWKIGTCLKNGETKEQWRQRVLQGGLVGLAFGVRDVPIRLTKRSKA